MMKVLFVASGNSEHYNIAPFIMSQAQSLREVGVSIGFFPVKGKGIKGYLFNIVKLRKYLKANPHDLVHAHYSLCGWVARLASWKTPVVLSLMGDDAVGTFSGENKIELKSIILTFLTRLIQPFVQAIISKSYNLEEIVYRKSISHIIPNGVRLEQFSIGKTSCRKELGLKSGRKYVLFLGDPTDANKNYQLAKSAVVLLNRKDVELLNVYNVPHEQVVKYLHSVDVFVLCSFSEGSPNVVKEAMACSCPMVVTDAGDAAWVAGDTPGCYVATYEPEDFAQKLEEALRFSSETGRTAGFERILNLGLDARSVAERIVSLYEQVLKEYSSQQISHPPVSKRLTTSLDIESK